MNTRPAILPAIPGRAHLDDARIAAPAIRAALQPGPTDALRPFPPGPRPPVRPTPPLASRTIHPGQGARVELQTRTLHRPPQPPVPYTLRDAAAVAQVRRSTAGRAAPMTYRAVRVVPVAVNRGA